MSTHVPGFQSFFRFLHNFVMFKLATSSIRVNIPFEKVLIKNVCSLDMCCSRVIIIR